MAKFRMNHSREGKGAGANVIRIGGTFFIVFILSFIFLGKRKLAQSLEESPLFEESAQVDLNTLQLQLDTLLNPFWGLKTSNKRNELFAVFPSCELFQGDSLMFNALYFINPDWLPVSLNMYYQDYLGPSNLTGFAFYEVSKDVQDKHHDCNAVLIRIIRIENGLEYAFSYLDINNTVLGEEEHIINFLGS
jgi:hypothetical protein